MVRSRGDRRGSPRPGGRLRRAAALLVVAAAVGCEGAPPAARAPTAPLPAHCPVSRLLVPACGAWWGAAQEPTHGQSQADAVVAFERRIGRAVPVVHLYHRGADLFPTPQEAALATGARPRVLFFNWRPEGQLSWAETAAGGPVVDRRIDRLAAHLRATLRQPFFLSITAEPEDEVNPAAGSGYTADDYRRMFRYVVQRLRADGVANMVTVMDYIATPNWVRQPWFPRLYPGNDVVDWLGVDSYLRQSQGARSDFAGLLRGPDENAPGWPGFLRWAASVAPAKPVMVAEWGAITDVAHDRLKVDLFRSFAATAANYPRIKAFIYWNSWRPLPVNGGTGVGNTQVEANKQVLHAFLDAVGQPYFARVTLGR